MKVQSGNLSATDGAMPMRALVTGLSLGSLLLLVGCGTTPREASPARAPEGRDPDRLLMVDCLLPGQMRRLGRNINFVTPRRPTRASASECEIRGGEYVAYDRANFATSLKTWLPQAESGDAHAQTLVGEIFEKGLGQVADPAVAAEWYRRAADQGYSRALINLGYLYESGLGVAQDLTRAMNLYREAAGFTDGSLEYVTSVELATRQQQAVELPRLREQVQESERQLAAERAGIASLRADYRELERQAADARQALADSEAASAARGAAPAGEVAALIGEIEGLKAQLGDADGRSAELLAALEAQQRQSGELRRRIAEESAELEEAEDALADQRVDTARLEAELAAARAGGDAASVARVATLAAELDAATTAREALQGEIVSLTADRDARTVELAAELELAEAKEASLLADLDGARSRLKDVEATLVQKDRDYQARLAALTATTGSLQQRVLGQQDAIAELEAQLRDAEDRTASGDDARSTEIDALREQLDEARRALVTVQNERAENDADRLDALSVLEAELERTRSEVAEKEAALGTLERTVSEAQANSEGPAIERVSSVVERGPVIEIIDPPVSVGERGFEIPFVPDTGAVDVVGRVSPAADLISFRVNGGATNVNQHGVFKHAASIAREPRLSLAAVDSAGDRTSLELLLRPETGAALPVAGTRSLNVDVSSIDFGGYHALIIGNSNYASLPALPSAATDATALSRLLERRYGFSTELLIDADRYDILASLNRKRDELARNDNLLIFFTGHSQLGGGQGYWLPVDADPADKGTWVSNVALTGLVDAMDAKHVMVVADAVFPATLSRSAIPRLGRSMDADERLQLYEIASTSKSRTVLSSGAAAPVAHPNDGEGRSVFGASVLDALDVGEDNVVMAHDVFERIRQRMDTADAGQSADLRPRYAPIRYAGHENGEFLFVPTDRRVGALTLPID